MKTAIATTSIHVPHTLALMEKLDPNVRCFLALDENTSEEVANFCAYDVSNTQVVYVRDQQKWKCSAVLPWRCIERRNLAILEALAWGAEIIIVWDNDNIPFTGVNYFSTFQAFFKQQAFEIDYQKRTRPIEIEIGFSGIEASSPTGWFDPGTLLIPQTPHRGFPYAQKAAPVFSSVVDARIGVAAGLCLGDSDMDATTRIVNAPIVHSVSELARAGVVVDPKKTKTVYNTQNTSFIRDLAPAMFQPPGVGRFSDIYASLICQRVMRERGLYVHFGQPYCWQTRNAHNLINDLRLEIDGMTNIETLAGILDAMQLTNLHPLDQTRRIYSTLQATATTIMPSIACKAALAFLDDMESIL